MKLHEELAYLFPDISGLLLFLACILTVSPAIWGIYQISHGHYLLGVLLIFVWGLLFIPFARFLDRRKITRFYITLPGAAIILILYAWAEYRG
jgi:hypothetical protein